MFNWIIEIIISLFAVIGIVSVFRELARSVFLTPIGKAEITVNFEENADKSRFVKDIFSNRKVEWIIKVPAESLSDFDRAELEDFIENGQLILF